jgi:cell division inhibitor SepF
MASTVRKIGEYLGLYPENNYAQESAGYDAPESTDYYEQYAPRPVSVLPETPASTSRLEQAVTSQPMATAGAVQRITTIHPRSYNDARKIGEDFRAGTPVIMNLSDMDDADARRIVDFSAGLAFGLHGTIEKVTKSVFLLSPANVDIGAAARAQLREDPFFNQS